MNSEREHEPLNTLWLFNDQSKERRVRCIHSKRSGRGCFIKQQKGSKQSISIIIPAYNEENRLPKTLAQIQTYFSLKKIPYEIIVVDDGSTDATERCIEGYKKTRVLKNKKNQGKGFSVRRGILDANHSLILITDADLSTPIEELEKFLPLVQSYDVIIASRNVQDSKIVKKQPLIRSTLGKMFPYIVQLFILKGIKDTQCGFKILKKEQAQELVKKQRIRGFAFDVELLHLARKKKYKIKEVPVRWINHIESKVNPFKDSYRMFRDILKIKKYDWQGKYD